MSDLSIRRYELIAGSAKKFWEVWTEGSEHIVRYGRIGSGGRTRRKGHPSPFAARATMRKLCKDKERKGYVETTNGATPPPVPTVAPVPRTQPPVPTPPPPWNEDELEEEEPLLCVPTTFLVGRIELHTTWYEVNVPTNDKQTAIDMVEDGECEEIRTDYIDALGANYWSVRKVADGVEVDDEHIDKTMRDEREHVNALKRRWRSYAKYVSRMRASGHAQPEEEESDKPKWTPSPGIPKLVWVRADDGREKAYDKKEELKKLRFGWQINPNFPPMPRAQRWRKEVREHEIPMLRREVERLGLKFVEES